MNVLFAEAFSVFDSSSSFFSSSGGKISGVAISATAVLDFTTVSSCDAMVACSTKVYVRVRVCRKGRSVSEVTSVEVRLACLGHVG